MTEEQEKAKLIKDALKIVDKLGEIDLANIDDDNPKLFNLIVKARELKRNRWWKLT